MKREQLHKKIGLIIGLVSLFLIPNIIFIVLLIKFDSLKSQILIGLFYVFWLIAITFLFAFMMKKFNKNNMLTNSSIAEYIESEIDKENVGTIVFLNTGTIVWISNFIEQRFTRSIIGKNINSLFNIKKSTNDVFDFLFEYENFKYDVHITWEKNLVILKDTTIREHVIEDYKKQRIVFGEINIDNISLYKATMSEDELFKVYSLVITMLENLIKHYDLIYRQYENGRFFILTNQETLSEFEKNRFKFFENLDPNQVIKDNPVTISAGFAYGIYKFEVLDLLAKEALLQSQTRGGNQTTILTKNEKSRHYGSFSEIKINISRTNVNLISKVLFSKLESKNIEKVIVYGHQNADLDAIGSAYAIYTLAKSYGKISYIQNIIYDDTTTRHIDKMLGISKYDIFINHKKAIALNDDKTLVVIVDTSDETRIENKSAFKNILKSNIVVIDHHRIMRNPTYALVNNFFIDSSASSASEIITEMIALSNNKDKINSLAAQLLLDGIYVDTNMFKKHISSKTFYACSLLEEWGASAEKSIISLKITEEIFNKVKKLNENLQEVKPGYFLSYADIDTTNDIIAIASDEILRVEGRKAAFVVGKLQGTNKYKLSARGVDTNVQIIAEAVNGGGHFGAAAAESDEPLEVFIDNIKQAIVSVQNESNNN